jgi:hypothetical protein
MWILCSGSAVIGITLKTVQNWLIVVLLIQRGKFEIVLECLGGERYAGIRQILTLESIVISLRSWLHVDIFICWAFQTLYIKESWYSIKIITYVLIGITEILGSVLAWFQYRNFKSKGNKKLNLVKFRLNK